MPHQLAELIDEIRGRMFAMGFGQRRVASDVDETERRLDACACVHVDRL